MTSDVMQRYLRSNANRGRRTPGDRLDVAAENVFCYISHAIALRQRLFTSSPLYTGFRSPVDGPATFEFVIRYHLNESALLRPCAIGRIRNQLFHNQQSHLAVEVGNYQ